MNPEIHATKPGKCPKCGMNLIKEKAKLVTKSVQKMFTIAFWICK
jgi:predicted nucleic-acid-binding Zn-ribbon protein